MAWSLELGGGVATDSQGGRAGGDRVDRCCRCRCRCLSAIYEAEGAPMVDVDLICAKGQVDAGVQVSEGWSKSREMSCEAEGPK